MVRDDDAGAGTRDRGQRLEDDATLDEVEDALIMSDLGPSAAARIRAKIGWAPIEGETDLSFLEAYYAALRRRLEQRMLLGERKAGKFDVR